MKNRYGMISARMVYAGVVAMLSLAAVSLHAREMGQMDHMAHAKPSVPSTQLTIRGLEGKSITLSPSELAALPHKSVSVYNPHTKANEKYSGVALADLLSKVGVPLGENVHGKLFMTGVIAEGTDHYTVLFALAEVDPSVHTGEVIVADSVDGHPLDKDGAFKLIASEERRPARWVRNLAQISVIVVNP